MKQLKEKRRLLCHRQVSYLSQKHDQLCQLLVGFVRLQFEDLYIGLIVSVLLEKLFKEMVKTGAVHELASAKTHTHTQTNVPLQRTTEDLFL